MPEIVVINGPPGVGKTTVATALSALQPGTVQICGDELRAFAPPDARRRLGGGSTYRAGAVLADAYLGMGAPRVLFDYVFLRPLHIAYFWNALGENVSAHLFTLWAPLEVVEARERMRGGRAPLGVAVAGCYREIEANRQVLGHFLQTGDVLPEVVAGEIHRLVASGRIQETEERACGNVSGRPRLIHCWKDKFC
jgi:predicted kinase